MTALGKSKLDPQTMIEWQKFTQAEKDVPSYTKFLEFLDLRATTTELTSFDANQRKSQPFNKKPKSYSPGNFNKSELIHATAQVKCLACNGQKHSIAYCQTLKRNPFPRSMPLYIKRVCLDCLTGKHIVKQCPSPHSCLKCGEGHHTLLHVDDSKPPENDPEVPKQDIPNTNLPPSANPTPASNLPNNNGTNASLTYVATPQTSSLHTVLMMTAEVVVSSPSGQQTTV